MKRIILVEDSPIIQAAAMSALGQAGYQVSVRTSGSATTSAGWKSWSAA